MWQIINKETGKFNKTNQNISLKIDSKNPQYISEQFNAFYINSFKNILTQIKQGRYGQNCQIKINYNTISMFVSQVTEEEQEEVNKLKDKFSAGYENN